MADNIMELTDIDETMKDHEIHAGDISSWLDQVRQVQVTGDAVDVPCGECTACCTSSYFIHIKPHESKTIARDPGGTDVSCTGIAKRECAAGI